MPEETDLKRWRNVQPLQPKPDVPLYTQLEEILREKIVGGAIAPGDMIPTELELAAMYNVSRTTARQAILNLVQEGLVYRVSGQGTFVQRRRPNKLRVVALICPFRDWYMLDLIEGIERILKAAGYELLVRNSEKNAEVEARQIHDVLQMAVAGVILWPKSPEFYLSPSAEIEALLASSVPTVVVNQFVAHANSVHTDHFGGGYLVGTHLAALGYQRIGFVTTHTQVSGSVQERLRGMREALANRELDTGNALCFTGWPDEPRFAAWLNDVQPEALFCANDFLALEVMHALSSKGLQIPGDVAVVGYDDISLTSAVRPALTTVRQDFKDMGLSAARLLVQRLQNAAEKPQHMVLPVTLQVRSSCGSADKAAAKVR